MHSTEGTGQLAYQKYGLKKFPAAGKTGTAYDFTDALFAGYDSTITCAVWAGFDKPQKIYRGAFGSVLALPVWVDVMNASARPVSAAGPSPSRRACTRSRSARSPVCSRPTSVTRMCASASGDVVKRRTSYVELATDEQMPRIAAMCMAIRSGPNW